MEGSGTSFSKVFWLIQVRKVDTRVVANCSPKVLLRRESTSMVETQTPPEPTQVMKELIPAILPLINAGPPESP